MFLLCILIIICCALFFLLEEIKLPETFLWEPIVRYTWCLRVCYTWVSRWFCIKSPRFLYIWKSFITVHGYTWSYVNGIKCYSIHIFKMIMWPRFLGWLDLTNLQVPSQIFIISWNSSCQYHIVKWLNHVQWTHSCLTNSEINNSQFSQVKGHFFVHKRIYYMIFS